MSDADLVEEPPEGPRAPKWSTLLAKSMRRADQLLDSEDDRIAGAMAQSLLAIAARTGVWKPGAADERGRSSGPTIRLTLEQTRLVAQGDPKALAELEKLMKLSSKAGPVSQLEALTGDE